MKIRIKTQEDNYFLKLMMILNNIPPFDKLRPQELELYAHLLMVNHKYRNIPFVERQLLIFNCETKVAITNKMGIKPAGVYNILGSLRLHKIIREDSLIPKYTLNKSKELTFIFDEEG